MDVQARVSAVVKVSKVVKWSRIFVRVFHNFHAIPIMNPRGFMIIIQVNTYVYTYIAGYMHAYRKHGIIGACC